MQSNTSPLRQIAEIAVRAGFTLREAEQWFSEHLLLTALETLHWNQCHVAKKLGVHRNTIARMIKLNPRIKKRFLEEKGFKRARVASIVREGIKPRGIGRNVSLPSAS